jgi:hypothetical protein
VGSLPVFSKLQTSYKPPGFPVGKKAKGGLERIAIFDKGKPGVIRGRKAADPTEPKLGGWPGCRKECESVLTMRKRLLCMRFTFNPEESVFLCPFTGTQAIETFPAFYPGPL